MAVKIKSLKSLVVNSGIKMLVHGPAGAGKTVLCCTTGEPTLLISAESGLLSVRDAPDYIKAAEVETLDDLEDLYDFLIDDAGETFKWVALDSITEIAERVLFNEKKDNKDPRAAYGKLVDHIMDLLRRFRDMKGYNVIMSCKQERQKDDGGPTFYGPMMPGQQLHQQIPYLFDEVFALRVEKDEDGEDYRVLQTSRDAKFEAKDRSGALQMFEEPNLKLIAEKIMGAMKDLKVEKAEKPKQEVEEEYEEYEEEEKTETEEYEEEAEEEIKIAEKKMYWYQEEIGAIGVIEKGEKIPDVEGIEFITLGKYKKIEKWLAEQEEEEEEYEEE